MCFARTLVAVSNFTMCHLAAASSSNALLWLQIHAWSSEFLITQLASHNSSQQAACALNALLALTSDPTSARPVIHMMNGRH